MTKKLVSYDDAAAAGARLPASVETEIMSYLSDTPRFLVFSTTWPARPNDDRRTFFLGGATSTNAPVDANLRSFDVWIPAS